MARTNGSPSAYTRAIREELARVDPLQPIYQMATLQDVIAQSVAARRFHTWLINLFAGLGLTLCAVGVFGTINYWVAERAREIGVRMALGATRPGVMRMVIGRAMGLSAVGVVVGLFLGIAASRAVAAFLFAVQPFDLATFAVAAVVVLTTGATAAYILARRAAGVDPLTVIAANKERRDSGAPPVRASGSEDIPTVTFDFPK